MSAHGFGGQAQQLGCSGVVGGQQKGSNALHFCECFLVRRDVSRGHVQVVGKEGGTGTHQCQFLELQNDQKEMASQLLPYIEQRAVL